MFLRNLPRLLLCSILILVGSLTSLPDLKSIFARENGVQLHWSSLNNIIWETAEQIFPTTLVIMSVVAVTSVGLGLSVLFRKCKTRKVS